MVELNLFPSVNNSDVMLHIAANMKPGLSDIEFLEREIALWLGGDERKKQIEAEAYYDGAQGILARKRQTIGENGDMVDVPHLPNNRLVNNQFAKMVDQKANYSLGRPITFDTENRAYGEALSKVFNKKMHRTMGLLAEKALIGGCVWVCPCYNAAGDFTFSVLPAYEVLPFWADTAHTELDCAVHLFPVYEYDNDGRRRVVYKAEVFHAKGVGCFIWQTGHLIPDNDARGGAYITATDPQTGKKTAWNWERIPLVCFKANRRETPLLCRVKCLQDALNLMLSDFVNNMQTDGSSTVYIVKNYDGEDLGEFRRNLITYGAAKVSTADGMDGGVETLEITVNADNYNAIIDALKKAIIENARGFDAKDERLSGTPNELNIRSMYSDIDLDANVMETEFQAAFEDLLFFVNAHLANSGVGNFDGVEVSVIFNRDILVNESEAIDNCGKSQGIISKETIVRQHPWVDDPEEELQRISDEEKKAAEEADEYRAAFENNAGRSGGGLNVSAEKDEGADEEL